MQPQSATTPLLRPNQVEEFKDEIKRIAEIEQQPPFIRNQIADLPRMMRYKRDMEHKLATEEPKPLEVAELDATVRRERELREQISIGMPTQAEMRRNPPGAVDKHRAWERNNKQRILEWKNIRLRLAVSGALQDCLPDSTDVASVERFRPQGGSGELNLDVAQIVGKNFHMPANPQSVVLTEAEIAAIREVSPETADKLAFMSPESRREIKDVVAQYTEAAAPMISTATLARLGYNGAKQLAAHLGMDVSGDKQTLFGRILQTHSGEPLPEKFAA